MFVPKIVRFGECLT